MNARRTSRLAAIAAALALLPACVGYQAATVQQVGLGDDVRVHTVDGRDLEFEVDLLERDALGGEGYRVPLERIEALEVRRLTATGDVFVGLTRIKQYVLPTALGVAVVVVLIGL